MPDNFQTNAATTAGAIFASDELAGAVQIPLIKICYGANGLMTMVEPTVGLPVSVLSPSWLTDAQLRLTAVPVSLTSTTVTGSVAVTQSGAWSLSANQSVNIAQINGVAPLMGNGVAGTGAQRVTIASDNTAFPVNATPPTLTKATQGATGYSVQRLNDAGRVIVNAATAIAGVTAVTTEALLTLNVSRDGAATAAVTTIAVTTGKRLRILGVTAGVISTGASVLSARLALRMNPAGAAAATSPIICILPLSQQAAALAQAGNEMSVMFSEAIEISGTMQVGLTQIANAVSGTVWASLIAYEY